MRLRLAILIPLLLVASSLISSAMLFAWGGHKVNQSIMHDGLSDINTTLTHLQNVLNTQLANDNPEDAKLSMSVSALHPGIRTLMLTDEHDKVVLANRYAWEGSLASQFSGYDNVIARQVRQSGASSTQASEQNSLLSGYYPVTLEIGTAGMSSNRVGLLFVEYDLSARLAQARHDVIMQAVSFGAVMMGVSIIVALLLHSLISKRVVKIVEASKHFASGDLDARVNMRGNDELAELGHAFDHMAAQRKEAESTLRQSEERLRFMLETSPIAVRIVTDVDHRVVFANQRYAELLNTDMKSLPEVVPLGYYANPAEYEEVMRDLSAFGRVSNRLIQMRVPGAGEKWTLASFLKLKYANEPAVLGWFFDVTEQKGMEEQLRLYQGHLEELVQERTARLSEAQRIGRIGNWSWDVASGEIIWSDEIYHLFGQQPGEFHPSYKNFLSMVHPEDLDAVQQSEQMALSQGQRHSVDHRIVLPDGQVRWVHEEAVPALDAEGNPVSLAGTVQDITERKQIESDLIAAKNEAERANLAKSEFLARMSHELRTPMNAILGFSQVLEVEPLTEEQQSFVQEIHKAGDHLLDLINDLLDLSRIESGRLAVVLRTVELDIVIDQATEWAKPFLAQKNVSLFNKCDKDKAVIADATRLKQVLTNLLSNAIKYNRYGGSVTLTSAMLGTETIRISVTDTGPGILPEQMQYLFKPFERLGAQFTDVEGSGIGLSLSKHLAELMGGELGMASVPGQGSSFWIELPLAQVSHANSAIAEQPEMPVAEMGTSRVLYIEDNAANLRVVEAILRRQPNLMLMSASNGEYGLELASQHQPDIILLDIHLPGMDGYAVLKELQKRPETRGIPVVALSADAMMADVERGLAAGFRYYLTKPLNADDLVNKVNELLGVHAKDG